MDFSFYLKSSDSRSTDSNEKQHKFWTDVKIGMMNGINATPVLTLNAIQNADDCILYFNA
uniref:Uncharacterized protein n=1 Tax=Echinococcus granulosus TaxID=6210 RepID=A0A068WBB6_ECHGR|nr:hypothetical protein EgrG_000971500 [Echinococcus granulosus]